MYKTILAIESSCDETAAAIVENGSKIISNVVATSSVMHEKWGGIVPEVAAREQLKSIIPVIIEALELFKMSVISRNVSDERSLWDFSSSLNRTRNDTGTYKSIIEKNIDAIAVTVGPGLIGSLLIGVETAKTIAYLTGKPIIPVNHVLAHMYANFLESSPNNSSRDFTRANLHQIEFPAISLVVSGGHTELFLMKSEKDLKWLGGTIDDAAGEAFDKTARLLGFGSRGGLAIQETANKFIINKTKSDIHLPRPLIHDATLNFSFSGLKTAIMREVNKLKENQQLNEASIIKLAYETQEAITDVLVTKTITAALKYQVKSILIGGGVAANIRLREKFKSKIISENLEINLQVPSVSLCTDNAAYIAAYAYFRGESIDWHNIIAEPNLSVEV
jgi:N6-L-threonylcarbamoyladenine synthase